MTEFLLRKNADVNIQNKFGYTALHVATLEGHERIVELLLKNGADKNIENDDGLTPMDLADKGKQKSN